MRCNAACLRRATIVLIVGALVLAGGGSVAVTKAGPQIPKQFYRPLGQGPAADHTVLSVAHNAGNHARTARGAVRAGAGVVEIDVSIYQGRLVAAHHLPKTLVNRLAWRVDPPASLADAWSAARSAPYLQLDLKTSAPELRPLLLDFLAGRERLANVIVSGPDLDLLVEVAAAYPELDVVLSIGSLCRLASVQADPASLDALHGVSVRASLLDEATVSAFHRQGLAVLAWTVDDPRGLDRVLRLGVDAVATNNLAIVEHLRGFGAEPASFRR